MHNIEIKTNDYSIPKLERIDGEPRVYVTPDGDKLPSVTAVTGLTISNDIQQWRKNIGEQRANMISSKASRRGTSVHSLVEKYITKCETFDEKYGKSMPDAQIMFNIIKTSLNSNLTRVHALEQSLWSKYLKVAGTVDCIGVFNGKLSVIDFKTSAKPKNESKIEHYFMQTAAYACAWYELTKEPINNLVVLIANEEDSVVQLFEKTTYPYLSKFKDAREQFFSKYGI